MPRKMLVVQSVMSNLFKTPIHSLGRVDAPEKVEAYGFETNNQTIIVAWTKEDIRLEIPLAEKSWRVIDIQGNELNADSVELTERPIYFISKEKGLIKFD